MAQDSETTNPYPWSLFEPRRYTGDVRPDDIERRIAALDNIDALARDNHAVHLYEALRRTRRVPSISQGKAWFLYHGPAHRVGVVGDWTCWRDPTPLKRIDGTQLFATSISFPATARLQYKLVVDGDSVIDPGNPYVSREGFGVNSEFWMDRYVDRSWLMPPGRNTPRGEIETEDFGSEVLGERRTMMLYTPAQSNPGQVLPLLLFHDGSEALEIGEFDRILDNLIAAGRIPPVAAVFLPPRRRNDEYSLNISYEHFSVREVIPRAIRHWAHRGIGISPDPYDRCVIGASLGGLLATITALRHPVTVGSAIAQSPAYWWNRGEIFATPYFRNAPRVRIALQTGTVCDARELTRLMYQKLSLAGAQVTYEEFHQGHTWGNWRSNLAEALGKSVKWKV